MNKKNVGLVFAKIFLTVILFVVAAGLGGKFGKIIDGNNYTSMSMALILELSLIIPIWYNSPMLWRIMGASVGIAAGVGVWSISVLEWSTVIATQSELAGFFRAGATVASFVACISILDIGRRKAKADTKDANASVSSTMK